MNVKQKVFCIGMNKTGTTSVQTFLSDHGYKIGSQHESEMLLKDFENLENDTIKASFFNCDAHQDVPCSIPNFYKRIDHIFPNSKFILTIRDSPQIWFNSLISFHTKIFSSTDSLPTFSDLMNSTYCYKGWILDCMKFTFNYPIIPLYDKAEYITTYLNHTKAVNEYFLSKPNQLLILNLSEKNGLKTISKFLGIKLLKNYNMPWVNKGIHVKI
jgi:hypothetical protein